MNEYIEYECYRCGQISDCELCYSCQDEAYYNYWDEEF